MGVCNKTSSFNTLHSLILRLIRSKSCKWKIKPQDAPHTIHIQTAALFIHAACFKLSQTSATLSRNPVYSVSFLQYFPRFPSLSESRWDLSNAVSAVPPSGLRHESQSPSKALQQKGFPSRLSPLRLPARMATCKITF